MSIVDTSATNKYTDLVKTENTLEMMDIKAFIRAINYNIDPLIVDEQWNMLNVRSSDELIVLTPQMLQRLNFCRTTTLIKKLEQLFPAPRGNNNEYWGDGVNVNIVLMSLNSTTKKSHGGARSMYKEIMMTKGAYKQLLMETQTDAAKQIRKYYICLEELFVQYLLYQRAHELVKAERHMDIMVKENKSLMAKMDIVIEQNDGLMKQNDGLMKQNEGDTR